MPEATPFQVMIVDDHPLMRRGVRQLLELDPGFEVVAEAGDGASAIDLANRLDIDVILLDLNMKGMSGLDTLNALRRDGVTAQIIILTVSDASSDVFALIDAGADGYLLKDSDPEVLLEAIRAGAKGSKVFSERVNQYLREREMFGAEEDPFSVLTERELAAARLLLRALLIEGAHLRACHAAGHAHAHERADRAVRVRRRRLHRVASRAREMRRRAGRVHERRVALHLLDHLLVFLVRRDGGNAEGDDLDAAQVAPLGAQRLVERVRQLDRVAGQRGVADAHFADLRERGLERGEQLGLELAVEVRAVIVLAHVAADVRVEQKWVGDMIAVLAEAADAHVDVDGGALIHDAERNGRRRAVLVADELLGVKIVHALILGRLAAEGEALSDVLERVEDTGSQLTGEDRRLGRSIIDKLARLGAELRHLALIDDDHTLSVGDCHDGAVGDDVLAALVVAAAPGNAVQALDRHHVLRNGFTVKILLPLVGHHTASRAQCCFNESHFLISLSLFTMPTDLPPQEYGCR